MGAFDFVLGFGKILKTSIEASTQALLAQVSGIGSIDPNDPEDAGEVADKQDLFGALGILARPPEKKNGVAAACDVIFARTSDGLVPIAYRDLRLNKAFPGGQKEGSVALVGYAGGFHSIDLVVDQPAAPGQPERKANIHVIYCPYDFDGSGVAQKAHAIIVDPSDGNESISITHGSGKQVSLTEEGVQVNIDANTWMQMKPGNFVVSAAKIMLKGNVYLGASAETGVPLLPGAASPPGPSVFISPA